MSRKLFRLLLAFAALAFVAGACSSSDDDDSANDEDQQENVDETSNDESAENADDDDEDETTTTEGDDDGDEGSSDDAVDLIEQMGFEGEAAECIADSLDSQGIDLEGLSADDVTDPDSDVADALAQAGMDCAEEVTGDLPAGSTDLSNPQVYDAFVEGFVSTSGLPQETAECVADYFLDNDINPADVLQGGDGASIVQDALADCQ